MKVVSRLMAMALAAWGLLPWPGQAAFAGDCCQGCGCNAPCKKVTCKIVCDKVKETHHFYVCECEDFCVPGPCCGGHDRECGECCGHGGCGKSDCGGCDQCDGSDKSGCDGGCGHDACGCCAAAVPSECHIYSRTNVIKYECEYEKCIYKCELVELCGDCCGQVDACDGVLHGDVIEGEATEGSPSDAMPPMPPALPESARGTVKQRAY